MPRNSRNLLLLFSGAVLSLALAGPTIVEEFTSSFESEENRDTSADSRFELWKAGYAITMDHPWIGVGPDAARVLVPKYSDAFSGNTKALHNLTFEVSTGAGIPALIVYLAFFAIPWFVAAKYSWRHRKSPADWQSSVFLAVASGIPGYWFASMFSAGALHEPAYVLTACGLCAIAIRYNAPRREVASTLKRPISNRYRPAIGGRPDIIDA